jgi:hypothetical protein
MSRVVVAELVKDSRLFVRRGPLVLCAKPRVVLGLCSLCPSRVVRRFTWSII